MVYALHKYRHYLLGGHFKNFIDHLALMYLVNKPMLGGGGESVDVFCYSRNTTLKSLSIQGS